MSGPDSPANSNPPPRGPGWKPGFGAWSVLGIAVLLGAATWWHYRQDRQTSRPAQLPVYAGESNHPDMQTIPVSVRCGYCHPKEFQAWANSDHAWAHRGLTPNLDSQPFKAQTLKAHHSQLRFITNPDGQRQVFDTATGSALTAEFAIGRRPLVQYLIPGKDGGYHTTSAAWDTLRNEWFDMFGADSRKPGEWGHWMGRGMIWNTQCAWCHMTGFDKNYDTRNHTWNSKWKEPGVSCIQCHGPVLAQPEAGTGCMVDSHRKISLKLQGDNCASCHARRDEFDHKFAVGKHFEDHFQLNLPTQPHLWWANGMQRDEVYTETGLKLSRMGHAGVGCLDCHDPHTANLRQPVANNELCMTCHGDGKRNAPRIDPVAHSHHPAGTSGFRCVECHMPETIYMARDPRRDHSFNLPDPALTIELGVPNACNMCHKDKTAEWAMQHVENWYGPRLAATRRARTRAVHAALHNDPKALEPLLAALKNEDIPGWRATMIELLQAWSPNPSALDAARNHADDPDPLVRSAVAHVLGYARDPLARRLLDDPAKNVRLRAAWGLRDTLPTDSPNFQELVAASSFQADQPAGAMKLAQLYAGKNDDRANAWFGKALEWDPTSAVVHRDYAVYLAGKNQSAEARKHLLKAVELEPDNASLHYLLALACSETGQVDDALASLGKAIKIQPNYTRALYNRALLLWQARKDLQAALADLAAASRAEPANPEFPYTMGVILIQAGESNAARAALENALKREPGYTPAIRALRQIP